jgi:uncharacterized membrane protein
MTSHLLDMLHLLLRWVHIIAAIMWIGDSFLFMWLDSHLSKTDPARGAEGQMVGELWMVHSGGFYEVYKRKYLRTTEMPSTLHWFKWESYSTWLSGACLLAVVYYLGAGALLVDPGGPMGHGAAVCVSIGTIVVAWGVYDLLCKTTFARNLRVAGIVGLGFVALSSWGYSTFLTGRAAFLHTGAMLGTIMACNVFFRIIPSQRALLAATAAGTSPDVSLGVRAKLRSTHNHYLTLPLLFTMMSNHFSSTYGHARGWLVFSLLCVFGVALKRVMITRGQSNLFVVVGGALAFAAVVVLTAPVTSASVSDVTGEKVVFSQVKQVIEARCVGCHAEKPTTPGFVAPPNGVVFDSAERIRSFAARIKVRAVDTKTMPLGNLTGMTDDERERLGRWVSQGAVIP